MSFERRLPAQPFSATNLEMALIPLLTVHCPLSTTHFSSGFNNSIAAEAIVAMPAFSVSGASG
jgi:hypothetical protein